MDGAFPVLCPVAFIQIPEASAREFRALVAARFRIFNGTNFDAAIFAMRRFFAGSVTPDALVFRALEGEADVANHTARGNAYLIHRLTNPAILMRMHPGLQSRNSVESWAKRFREIPLIFSRPCPDYPNEFGVPCQ